MEPGVETSTPLFPHVEFEEDEVQSKIPLPPLPTNGPYVCRGFMQLHCVLPAQFHLPIAGVIVCSLTTNACL